MKIRKAPSVRIGLRYDPAELNPHQGPKIEGSKILIHPYFYSYRKLNFVNTISIYKYYREILIIPVKGVENLSLFITLSGGSSRLGEVGAGRFLRVIGEVMTLVIRRSLDK